MKKTLFIVISCFLVFQTTAQDKLLKKAVFNRVIINTPDSTTYAQTLSSDKRIRTDDQRLYYWYKSDQVRVTRGGYDGRLLHGDYKQFYGNHNLKEKGRFHKGLRSGKWRFWHPNGELQEIVHYKRGKRNGRFETYTNSNIPIQKGRYRNDQVVGRVKNYDINGKLVRKGKKKKKKNEKPTLNESQKVARKSNFFSRWVTKKDSTSSKKMRNLEQKSTTSEESLGQKGGRIRKLKPRKKIESKSQPEVEKDKQLRKNKRKKQKEINQNKKEEQVPSTENQ